MFVLACSVFVVCFANAQPETGLTVEDSVKRFLQSIDDNKTTRYVVALRDLNEDGVPEAIVYLVGNEWCGSGGCNMLVLKRNGVSWSIVTKIRIARTPIRILPDMSNGWHSIGVWVQGGGIQYGYDAELDFNGVSYPSNPSIPPARRLKSVKGDVVILSASESKPLYDGQ